VKSVFIGAIPWIVLILSVAYVFFSFRSIARARKEGYTVRIRPMQLIAACIIIGIFIWCVLTGRDFTEIIN